MRSDFHYYLSIAVHALPLCILTLISENEILLLRNTNWSTNLRSLPLNHNLHESIWTLFYLSSHSDWCLLLSTLSFATEIWLEQVHSQKTTRSWSNILLKANYIQIQFLSDHNALSPKSKLSFIDFKLAFSFLCSEPVLMSPTTESVIYVGKKK